MACGTPVIARPRGSMPELIRDGENGFLVHTIDEAVAALERVLSLDRASIRRYAEKHFSVKRMADEYLAAYRRVLDLAA